MIYKILIIDDEPFILSWLKKLLITNINYDFEVNTAKSGEEGIRIIKEKRFDILLTDIEMNGVNGIECAKYTKEKWPSSKIVFLTAYSNFKYAKSAFDTGAIQYILKSQSDDQILNAINLCVKEIDKERRNRDLILTIENKNTSNLQFYQNKLLHRIYKSTKEFTLEEIKKYFKEYDIPIDFGNNIQLLICRIDNSPVNDFLDIKASQNETRNIFNIVSKYLSNRFKIIYFTLDIYTTRYIYFLFETTSKIDKNYIFENLEIIQQTIYNITETEVSFSFNSQFFDLTNWKYGFIKLQLILDSYYDNQNIILDMKNEDDKSLKLTIDFRMQMSTLRENIIKNKYSNCNEIIDYFLKIDKKNSISFYNNTIILIEYLINKNKQLISDDKYMEYTEFENKEKAYNYLKLKVKDLCSKYNETNVGSADNIVVKIKEYIRENILNDFSINEMSNELHYNPSYLSRIFRNSTNITITSYANKVKINQIKALLENNEMNINSISKKAGFNSNTYFSKYFKQHTGLSPSEYIREYGNISK